MGDVVKKKSRRLKRTVRRTLGTLFLVSSLVVAAIPTNNFSMRAAATESDWGTLDSNWSGAGNIPQVKDTDRIYTTGDGKFQFAYVYPKGASSGDRVAVILGYAGGQLLNNTLQIPNTVDAYAKLSDNLGTEGGRTAVGKSGNFLYYRVDTERFEEEPKMTTDEGGASVPALDEEGNQIYETVKYIDSAYYPCYYEDRSKWQELEIDQFYYYPDAVDGEPQKGKPALTSTSDVQRITNAEVWYIGNQYLTAGTGAADGTWTVGGTVDFANKDKGIFSGQSNIITLLVGEKLSGIGDYAFYDCANLRSITLNNGLNTIGVGSFANCINMNEVNIDQHSYVSVIGDYAFYNCQALAEFTVPNSVRTIGNSAFEDCFGISHIEISGKGENVLLSNLGENVFRGCESLASLTFPRQFTQEVDIATFEGCSALKYIATPDNRTINFVSNSGFTFDQLKKTLPATFYFKGVADSAVHKTATREGMAFSYLDGELNKNVYELTVTEGGKKVVYRVDDDDNLVYCNMESGMETVTLPATIGPNQIRVIDSYTFQGNHYLTKITIPESITQISPNAFRGCHNLKYVLFDNPANLTSIGDGAFRTQDGVTHNSTTNCNNTAMPNQPELSFVGPISYDCVPFQYAMNPEGYINNGSQERTYIKYYSGWPTHLEVQYNKETDKNELINYPTFADVAGAKYTMADYPYMTEEYVKNMTDAVSKYTTGEKLTDYENQIINAALNLELPAGIESIKKDLFVVNEGKESSGLQKNIKAYSLQEVEDGAFRGCRYLASVTLSDATTKVGNYAFDDCSSLINVNLPATVQELGVRPFKGCSKLSTVLFSGGPYFSCDNSIIYELDDNGGKEKIVECLEGRNDSYVTAAETAGVKELYPEAFMGTDVVNVELTNSEITTVPEYAFAYTSSLTQVALPNTVRNIQDNAFKNSNVRIFRVPGQYQNITTLAFGDGIYDSTGDSHTAGDASKATNLSKLQFICEPGSMAEDYAKTYNIPYSNEVPEVKYSVSFYDRDSNLLETVIVKEGEAATPPTPPEVEGYTFTGWKPENYLSVMEDIPYVQAQYEKNDIAEYTVTFVDDDENATVLFTRTVQHGEDVILPPDPVKPGYDFKGWRGGNLTAITQNETVYAYYEKQDAVVHTVTFVDDDANHTVLSTQQVPDGGNVILPQNPTKEGYEFKGWLGNLTNITEDEILYAQYEKKDIVMHTITFVDDDANKTVLFTQQVPDGGNVTPPQDPKKEGHVFKGWLGNMTNITKDETLYAQYAKNDVKMYTVTFIDDDENKTVLLTKQVPEGGDATPPANPTKEGYEFKGWLGNLTNITKDEIVYAQYDIKQVIMHTVTFVDDDANKTVLHTQQVPDGGNAVVPQSPTKTGYVFKTWLGTLTNITRDETVYAVYEKAEAENNNDNNDNNSGNNNNNNNNPPNNTVSSNTSNKLYTLTVQNGSGSGSYAEGSQPIIIAGNPASGQEFSHWTIAPAGTKIASTVLSASVITMPAGDVTVTAHYKAKPAGSTGTGNSSNTNYNRPNNNTNTTGGTTVVIDKNGLSNTGVVSATVNGSSDNFTIKISESSTATEAVLRALIAEYGSDLSNIKYVPMDISLYDVTGTKEITDTAGLSISITLPLPDSLILYAGNNKVAGVVSDRLDKLSPKFITIDGVPCVTFKAEHFSPYVIYVDTSRLSEGTVVDDTPKTGDGIHPKWFLSIGLACLSFVMFMQKDNRKKEKVKAKARA